MGIASKVSKLKIVSTRNDEKVEDMIKSGKGDMKGLFQFSVVSLCIGHILADLLSNLQYILSK
jgi:hypothetical protein